MVNFLYFIGFSLGGELAMLACESYLLSFFHPFFSGTKLVSRPVFLIPFQTLFQFVYWNKTFRYSSILMYHFKVTAKTIYIYI